MWPIGYRWMFSSCEIGFISPALCRLEIGTTCSCTEGDFSSPMRHETIASRSGRISGYQTFKLLLILCMNKSHSKPFLRSLNWLRVARFPFLLSLHSLWKASTVNSVRWREGWSALAEASLVTLTMLYFWVALFRRIFFISHGWGNPPILLLMPFYNIVIVMLLKESAITFLVSHHILVFSLNKSKFDHHKSLSTLWRASQNTSQWRGLGHQEWMHC